MNARDEIYPIGEPEPERYELREPLPGAFDLDRREFFGVLGAGLVVVLTLGETRSQEAGGERRKGGGGRGAPAEIGAWLHIAEDGSVSVFTGKVEVGQDVRTSLAQAVAEELTSPLDSVRLTMGDTDLTPPDGGTSGSQTTPTMASRLRKVAAAAREALLDLAARELSVDRAALAVAEGKVSHAASGRSLAFGQLTRGQKLLQTVGDGVPTAPAERWKVAGRPAPRANGRALVTGAHRYPSDIQLPGMLHGKVLRPPAFDATLISLDDGKARSLPGITVVREGSFTGVVAPDPQLASRAIAALRAEWKEPAAQPSVKDLFGLLKSSPSESRGRGGPSRQDRGSMEEGLAAAHRKLEATYTVAYIAHAPLEPRAAVAEWKDGRLTVWTGTQRPFGVRSDLAQALGVPAESVRVVVPDTGSGYGGKHSGEAALEAARLARAAGKPVKLVWTREEEFTWAYFRPAGVIEVKSGATKDGDLTAWEYHNYNSGSSSIRMPYEVPHQRIEFHGARSPLRQGSYRALASTANTFARESHLDELAHALGLDPLQLRLRNLKDARLRAVLEAAAERFGWRREKPAAGRGHGIACGTDKGSYVAACAEVTVDRSTGRVKVERVVSAFECGAIVNPGNLRNQVEGAVVMGLGGALFEKIDFEGGRVLNPRFSDYRVPRFGDLPVLDTVLLDRKDLPSAGAGETPIVAVAPAVANALFQAAGTRLRSLPLAPEGTIKA